MTKISSQEHDPSSRCGLISIRENGKIEGINLAAANIVGTQADQIKGKLIYDFFPDLPNLQKMKWEDTAEGSEFYFELNIQTVDHQIVPCQVAIHRIFLMDQPLYMLIVADRKEVNKGLFALNESQLRLEAIFEVAVDGIIIINDRGVIEILNMAAAKLFNYKPEELIGQKVNVLMPEPYQSQHDEYLGNYLNTGEARIIGIGREVSGKKKDGSIFPFRLSISEVQLPNRKIFTGIVHDLTAEKQAMQKLKRYASELERSNRELQDFAYISSHDLQEPLRKIQAFGSRLAQNEQEKLTERGQDYLQRMLRATERMQRLINDLLSYSRVSTNTQPFVQVNLNVLVEDVLSDLELAIEQRQAKITVGILPTLEADPTHMQQLFQNLLSNALKFQKEGIALEIKIASEMLDHGPGELAYVEITVEDNGIGFDDKYANRIFNIFQRLEGQRYEGSGIGLSICKRIVSRHNGTIRAESQPGKGSTFFITLPITQPKAQESKEL